VWPWQVQVVILVLKMLRPGAYQDALLPKNLLGGLEQASVLDPVRLLESSADPGLWMGSSWTCPVKHGQTTAAARVLKSRP